MIAEPRTRHRRMWIAVALLVPAIVIAAWRARRPVVVMDALPSALVNATSP